MEDLQINGPTQALPGTKVVFAATGVLPDSGLAWRVRFGGELYKSAGAGRFCVILPHGVHVIDLVEVSWQPDSPLLRYAEHTIKVDAGLPPDTPVNG